MITAAVILALAGLAGPVHLGQLSLLFVLGAVIYQSTVATNLKKILSKIVMDKTDGLEDGLVMKEYMDDGTPLEDAYDIDLEVGGPGLASEKPEGDEMQIGGINEGYQTTYVARTFALKLLITDEAREDYKYPEIINLYRHLKISLYKTVEYDAANVPARGWNSNFVGGDGVSLFNTAHTLPAGGTWSNTMAVPMTPSRQAVIAARAQAIKFPGHHGLIEGYQLKEVCFPSEQWGIWEEICGSSHAPEAGQFNAINVVYQKMKLEPVEIKYWTNTTTNYFFRTDCPNGLQWRWRRRPKSKTWLDNDQEIEKAGISARWARGWSDARGVMGVQA